MNELQQVLESPNKTTIFLTVLAAFIAFKFLVSIIDWFKDRYGIETKATRREKSQSDTINRLQDEFQDIKKDQDDIKSAISCLQSSVNIMQDKQNRSNQARLKDRIAQGYRYFSAKGEWTKMDKEAFDDLVASYEDAGGKNSFVHNICLPESMTWNIIDEKE